jgi:hypothetical protein
LLDLVDSIAQCPGVGQALLAEQGHLGLRPLAPIAFRDNNVVFQPRADFVQLLVVACLFRGV